MTSQTVARIRIWIYAYMYNSFHTIWSLRTGGAVIPVQHQYIATEPHPAIQACSPEADMD